MISEGSTNGPGAEAARSADPSEEVTPPAGTPRPPSIEEELSGKLAEAEKKYLYLFSEFENFRRRNERDRLEFLKFGHEPFLKDLLQVLDNFERAISHAKSLGGEKGSPLSQLSQGVEMIHYQFFESLKSQGVSAVPSVGQKFDPALHEAVGEEEGGEPGSVIREMQKGYLLHGRLLRPARVVLAKKN